MWRNRPLSNLMFHFHSPITLRSQSYVNFPSSYWYKQTKSSTSFSMWFIFPLADLMLPLLGYIKTDPLHFGDGHEEKTGLILEGRACFVPKQGWWDGTSF